MEFWGTRRNLDATIAGVSKAWNQRFWKGRLANSHAFSIVCDEDEERTATGLYSLLRRHPDVSTLFVRKWDALLVLSEALSMTPTNGICGTFITTLDLRNLTWETVTSWSLACPLLAVCLMDNRLPSLQILKIGEETTHPYFSPVPVQSILSAFLPDVSKDLCELHFTSRLQQDNWRTLAAVLEARHRSSRCRGMRVLEHDWCASIDGDSLARIMQVCWVTLECLGSPVNPWTEKAALMVGDAICDLEATCLQDVHIRGDRDESQASPDALFPLAYVLESRAPQLRLLEVRNTSLHNAPFVLMCRGLEKGNWYGLMELQVANCHLTVENLKVFTAALRTMESAVFHRLLLIDLSETPSLGASCGSFLAGVLCRPAMFPSLRSVVLDKCEVGDVGLSIILHALASWPTCAPRRSFIFSVNACRITDKGILLLVDYLKEYQIPLRMLSASDNPGIMDVGGLALIEAINTRDSPVKTLELENIGMTRQAVLEAAMGAGNLTVMYYTGNSGFADDTTRRFKLVRRQLNSLLTDG